MPTTRSTHTQVEARLERALSAQRGRLWGLCYRMAGCAADADDWLQDVFERALTRPPRDLEADLAPWLTRVTMNVCRDHLRRRAHRAYAGPWLPGPLETSELWARLEGETPSPEARYDQLQSVSLAFLHALSSLTPNQRAVLLLRDVCDLSVREAAEALELSEATVKTTHHRARAALVTHDVRPRVPAPVNQRALEAFLVHLALRNVDALSELVAEHVVELHDGAGEYTAAQRPIRGLAKLMLFHRNTARPVARVLLCSLNGQPGLLMELAPRRPWEPVRCAMWLRTDRRGRVLEVHAQVADRKLLGLPFEQAKAVDAALVWRVLRTAWTTPEPARWRRAALGRSLRALATLPSWGMDAMRRRRDAKRRSGMRAPRGAMPPPSRSARRKSTPC